MEEEEKEKENALPTLIKVSLQLLFDIVKEIDQTANKEGSNKYNVGHRYDDGRAAKS